MSRFVPLICAFFCLVVLPTGSASADQTIDEVTAISMAMKQSPSMQAAILDHRRASENARAEEGLYVPSLVLDSTGSRSTTLFLVGPGTIINAENQSATLGSEIRRAFPTGTNLALRLQGTFSESPTQMALISGMDAAPVRTYGITGKLTLSQPLLRGYGRDVGEASLRQARLSRTLAERTRDQTASTLLRDVLIAYWDLWFASQSVEIENSALKLAKRSRDEVAGQIEAGALAPAERFTFETRVSNLEQSLLLAQLGRRRASVALGTLIGSDADAGASIDGELVAEPGVPSARPMPGRSAAIERALAESQELAQSAAQLALVRDQARIAGESTRPRLDLHVSLQADGLGSEEVSPAIEQFGTLDATGAFVSLVYEAPLKSKRLEAQRKSARLSSLAAEQQMRAQRDRIVSAVTADLMVADAAIRRIELAERTVALTEQQLVAQKGRYEEGDAIALEVHQAEDAVRAAQLSVARARTDLVQAQLRIEHYTGELLSRHGSAPER